MQHHFLIALIATMLAFAGSAALAQQDTSNGGDNDGIYNIMDDNGDGKVGASEFKEYFAQTDVFENWDDDGNGMLSDYELGLGLYNYYKHNNPNFDAADDPGESGFWDF